MNRKKKYKNKNLQKQLTFSAKVLLNLFLALETAPEIFHGKTVYYKKRIPREVPYRTYLNIMNALERKGWLQIYKVNNERYIKLTKAGTLQALFSKASFPHQGQWDGKWRMVVFDIPEEAKPARRQMRHLLRANGFKLIQKSVYINPYPLNREAIVYLKETGLDDYIRIFRIDDADNEAGLKKLFGLN